MIYASPFIFSFPLFTPALCLLVRKPGKSVETPAIETSKRPFSTESERISGLGTRLGDFSSKGEKRRHRIIAGRMSVDRFFSMGGGGGGGGRWGEVCRVQRFHPALSTDPSLIVRFNSGFDHHFYSAFPPCESLPVL